MDANYVKLMKLLFDEGVDPAEASHDETIVREALRYTKERGLGPERFEFQMLYGIRRDLQREIVADGQRLRLYVPYGDAWYPYFMRRLAERPANVLFLLRNLIKSQVFAKWITFTQSSGQFVKIPWLRFRSSRTMDRGETMKISRAARIAIMFGLLASAFHVFADSTAAGPYPVEYRKWAVTRSFIAAPESKNSGFHHYYANPKAVEGFITGKFPEGSVIVDERLEVEQHDGGSYEGKRISIAVMMKDSQRYAETGGWGFDGTLGDGQTLGAPAEMRASCYSCHVKQKHRDFVFSTLRK